MKIVVAGATGLVGTTLVPALEAKGHQIVRLGRAGGATHAHSWDPAHGKLDAAILDGAAVVINLAGANVAGGRWTHARRHEIMQSRVDTTRLLVETMSRQPQPPEVFVCASAAGIYGDTGEQALDETAPPGDLFLSDVCRRWEAEARRAEALGTRVVSTRFGAILAREGGVLGKLVPVFRAGLGGPAGTGRQWLSWVAIDDVVGAIEHIIANPMLSGAVNVVAPEAVRNADFATALGRVLKRPAIVPAPAAMLRVLYGQMAEETVLLSSRLVPGQLRASGYSYRHAGLEDALRHVLARA